MNTPDSTAIAIIGMSLRVPGASDLGNLWENLIAGRDCLTRFGRAELDGAGVPPNLYAQDNYVPVAGILPDIALFDAGLFELTPREASLMDPQYRLLLECSWEAIEDGGYAPGATSDRVGVFAGIGPPNYLWKNLNTSLGIKLDPLLARLLNDKDFAPAWIAYKLNLRGPVVAVQTACSTSLTSIHLAAQSLLAYECDLALAGGATVRLPQTSGYLYRKGGIESRDGRCRPFDAEASGTVSGSGAGMVLLKRASEALRDRDPIHALILGTAVNNDGADRQSFTAPNVKGQTAVMLEAWSAADVAAETISYIEAHGTGTLLGDAVELEAVSLALSSESPGPDRCLIGSIKSNVGHLDTAAGIAGVAKAVLAMKHRTIPPTAHYVTPTDRFDLQASPLEVADRAVLWEGPRPFRAGVNSFGMGGSNVHLLLEEPPSDPERSFDQAAQLLILSAKSQASLDAGIKRLGDSVRSANPRQLADISLTYRVARRPLGLRATAVGNDPASVARALQHPYRREAFRDPVAMFVFPGQAAPTFEQVPNVTELPRLAARIGQAVEVLEADGHVSFDADNRLLRRRSKQAGAVLAQVLPLAYGIGLADSLADLGVSPVGVVGHSVGELVAATYADVLDFGSAVSLLSRRAELMEETAPGAMLAVRCPAEQLVDLQADEISLSAINAADEVVLAGSDSAISTLYQELVARSIPCRRLPLNRAFHSSLMDPILPRLRAIFASMPATAPTVPIISTVTADWLPAGKVSEADHWIAHAREPVRFSSAIDKLAASHPQPVFIELGVDEVLAPVLRRKGHAAVSLRSLRRVDRLGEYGSFLSGLGELWASGLTVNWEAPHRSSGSRRVHAPTYQFDRATHWVESAARAPAGDAQGQREPDVPAAPPPPGELVVEEVTEALQRIWCELFGVSQVHSEDDFFSLGGNSLLAIELVAQVRSQLGRDLEIVQLFDTPTLGELAAQLGKQSTAAPHGEEADVEALLDDLTEAVRWE